MKGIAFTDVTLRDGLQMQGRLLGIDEKLRLYRQLLQCSYSRIEITSFVHSTAVPQFADAEAFCEKIFLDSAPRPELMAFVPNEKGMQRLESFPIEWVACFVSVSEAFNQKNVRSSVEQSLDQVKAVVQRAKAAGRKVRVYVSTVFGCPYQGKIDSALVKKVFSSVASFAPDEIALGDTIGVATPDLVREVLKELVQLYPIQQTAMHLHNTYGLALPAAFAAYDLGIRRFDGSTGGLGGCPYAKGASGNVASEDLLYAFFRQGIVHSFAGRETQETLKLLNQDLGLGLQGALAGVWKNGGSWYGV